MHQRGPRETRTTETLCRGNAGENNQEQGRHPDTGESREEVNMIKNERKARPDFKIKQETPAMTL